MTFALLRGLWGYQRNSVRQADMGFWFLVCSTGFPTPHVESTACLYEKLPNHPKCFCVLNMQRYKRTTFKEKKSQPGQCHPSRQPCISFVKLNLQKSGWGKHYVRKSPVLPSGILVCTEREFLPGIPDSLMCGLLPLYTPILPCCKSAFHRLCSVWDV